MIYNFDKIIAREGTDSYKYDLRQKLFGKADILPLWVADMDFEIAPEIQEAIIQRTLHGIFGYTYPSDSLRQSVAGWMERHHEWQFDPQLVLIFHGIVPSLNLIVHAFTQPGDKIIVQSPVYYPFFDTIKDNGRQVLNNRLLYKDGNYFMDFDALEQQIDHTTKVFFLCHPHNPAGRVWTRDELIRLDQICQKHNILMVSDEIHCDIVFDNQKHIPYATISEYASQNTITCIAPSKTFNIAGLAVSAIVTGNKKTWIKLNHHIRQWQLHGMNVLGYAAFEAAYNKGDEWYKQLMEYLHGNLNFLENFIIHKIPQIKLIKPQATYLAWLDFSSFGFTNEQLKSFVIEKAGLALSNGPQFGPGGEGFQRLNFACPRTILEKGLTALKNSIDKL